jgi:hypothetical protein
MEGILVSDGGMATNVVGRTTDMDSTDIGESLGDSSGGKVSVGEETAWRGAFVGFSLLIMS